MSKGKKIPRLGPEAVLKMQRKGGPHAHRHDRRLKTRERVEHDALETEEYLKRAEEEKKSEEE